MLYASHDYQSMACGPARVPRIMSDVFDSLDLCFGFVAEQQRGCWSRGVDDDLHYLCYWCLGMSIHLINLLTSELACPIRIRGRAEYRVCRASTGLCGPHCRGCCVRTREEACWDLAV
jgi:hypothetical protein